MAAIEGGALDKPYFQNPILNVVRRRIGWLMLVAVVLWAGVYDTMYAMVDREDDRRIGVKSTALLFGEDHVTEIRLHDDRRGLLVMTRDRERFARALGRIAVDGHRIESVLPADENVDALYEYLIGGE